jgi:hypothetical protein
MRKSFFTSVLLAGSLLGAASCKDGQAALQADGNQQNLWIGSSHITFSRATTDMSAGYTMRADFWFRIDRAGNVRGKAYAVYQPTFEANGMNAKITMAKTAVAGALSILPGGQLALARTAVEAGKGATNVTVAGLVGVTAKFKDPKPVRSGAITGTLRGGTLTLDWADKQPDGIPAEVSLQYLDRLVPLSKPSLKTREPWAMAATLDADSGGRFAIAQARQPPPEKGEVKESMFAYWNATRVD